MDAPEADLTGWTASPFTAGGITHDVYRKGEGPGVVLIPEIPGIHPGVLALGNYLVDNGFSVASPSLFGEPGRPVSAGYLVPTMARACVAREFMALATNAERPVARYRRWPATSTSAHLARAWASSACASPEALHWRRPLTTAFSRR
jgi:dienelactone hydrolase